MDGLPAPERIGAALALALALASPAAGAEPFQSVIAVENARVSCSAGSADYISACQSSFTSLLGKNGLPVFDRCFSLRGGRQCDLDTNLGVPLGTFRPLFQLVFLVFGLPLRDRLDQVFQALGMRDQLAPSMTLRSSSSLSFVSEICSTLPFPVNSESPASTLSPVALRTSTNMAEQPGLKLSAKLFIMALSMPMSVNYQGLKY